MKIFKCKDCGNIAVLLKEEECIPNCCGSKMLDLKANSVDAAFEKHIPVIKNSGSNIVVTCGEVLHPMEENHYIEFMIIETNVGFQIKYLKPGDAPKANFVLSDSEELISVYAYCNLHGLWINKVK